MRIIRRPIITTLHNQKHTDLRADVLLPGGDCFIWPISCPEPSLAVSSDSTKHHLRNSVTYERRCLFRLSFHPCKTITRLEKAPAVAGYNGVDIDWGKGKPTGGV